jgi:hypothetical protein
VGCFVPAPRRRNHSINLVSPGQGAPILTRDPHHPFGDRGTFAQSIDGGARRDS